MHTTRIAGIKCNITIKMIQRPNNLGGVDTVKVVEVSPTRYEKKRIRGIHSRAGGYDYPFHFGGRSALSRVESNIRLGKVCKESMVINSTGPH